MKNITFIKVLLLLVIFACTHNVSIAASAEGNSVESKLAMVLENENKNQVIKALSQIKTIFDSNQRHTLTRIYYGRLLVKNGDSDKAIAILQPLAKDTMSDWRPWFWLGTAQLISGQLGNAAYSLDEALVREGNVISLWVQRAIVEQESGNFSSAVHLLQVADSIEPGNSDVMINYAYASELSGDINKAIIIYKHFLKITASNSQYGRLRSQILYRLSHFENINNNSVSPEKNQKS